MTRGDRMATAKDSEINSVVKGIHGLLVSRLVRQCKLPEEVVRPLAVGHLLNILFLYRGEFGDVGHYETTARALYELIGFDGLWKPPIVVSDDEKQQQTVD